ncbi:MAG: peroxidase-related enzyme [Sphingomonas sp.]|nr:peroxidase-related enzyme [Sphingomonas sp.]
MPRIAPVDLATAETGVQATLAGVQAKIGMVPNLFKTFARSPSVLNAFLAFSDSLAGGSLSARQGEIVALAVAQANGCEYCLSAHSLIGKGAGLSADAIAAARKGKGIDSVDHAIASLARALVENRGQVSDAQLAEARLAGLDDAQIVDIVAAVALNTMTNFMNNVAHTTVDFPKVDMVLAA